MTWLEKHMLEEHPDVAGWREGYAAFRAEWVRNVEEERRQGLDQANLSVWYRTSYSDRAENKRMSRARAAARKAEEEREGTEISNPPN